MNLIIYGRFKESKRMSPFNVCKGDFVINKIDATLIPEFQIENAIKVVEMLNDEYDSCVFELRKADGNKIGANEYERFKNVAPYETFFYCKWLDRVFKYS